MSASTLKTIKEIEVRFNELDPLRIVWHGNYVKYFEDGREEFGKRYGISYIDVKDAGVATPIINFSCDYKKALQYPETILVETTYVPCKAAKIILNYKLFRKESMELMAEGQTTQVFTDFDGNLLLCAPEFYESWKLKWKVEC